MSGVPAEDYIVGGVLLLKALCFIQAISLIEGFFFAIIVPAVGPLRFFRVGIGGRPPQCTHRTEAVSQHIVVFYVSLRPFRHATRSNKVLCEVYTRVSLHVLLQTRVTFTS